MKYGNRSLWQRFIASPFSIVFLIIVVFVLARAGFNIWSKVETSANQLGQAEASLARVTERQIEMSRKVEYLSTDQGIEAEIRTKYHAVKDGEQVAVIVDDSQKSDSVENASSTADTDSPGFLKKILQIIGF